MSMDDIGFKIIADIAADDEPLEYGDYATWCRYCKSAAYDMVKHERDCVWVRARSWNSQWVEVPVEALENWFDDHDG